MTWLLKLFNNDLVVYGAAAVLVFMGSIIGVDKLWTIPRLESRAVRAEKGWEGEKTARLADRAIAAEAAASQERKHRQIEQGWLVKQQEAEQDAQTKIESAKADAAAAAAASGRLRDRLAAIAALARRGTSGALAPSECAPAIQASDMQSQLLLRLEARGRELAAYADSARIAGEACVAAWPQQVTP